MFWQLRQWPCLEVLKIFLFSNSPKIVNNIKRNIEYSDRSSDILVPSLSKLYSGHYKFHPFVAFDRASCWNRELIDEEYRLIRTTNYICCRTVQMNHFKLMLLVLGVFLNARFADRMKDLSCCIENEHRNHFPKYQNQSKETHVRLKK